MKSPLSIASEALANIRAAAYGGCDIVKAFNLADDAINELSAHQEPQPVAHHFSCERKFPTLCNACIAESIAAPQDKPAQADATVTNYGTRETAQEQPASPLELQSDVICKVVTGGPFESQILLQAGTLVYRQPASAENAQTEFDSSQEQPAKSADSESYAFEAWCANAQARNQMTTYERIWAEAAYRAGLRQARAQVGQAKTLIGNNDLIPNGWTADTNGNLISPAGHVANVQVGQAIPDGWISVDDRLPGEQGQDSENILVFFNGHCKLTDSECRKGGGWGHAIGWYDAEKGLFRSGGIRRDITHWMPLPAAPIPAKEQS